MFKLTKTQIRQNDTVPFFHELISSDAEARMSYFIKKYKDTGKFISATRTLSDDKLTCTNIAIWKSHEDFLDLITDPQYYEDSILPNKKYDEENNILSTVIGEGE